MMDVFLKRENLGKLSTRQGSPLGLWTEFLATLFPLLPWLLFSLASVSVRKTIRENRSFLIAFALIPALFFTFFPYRVNTYLYLLTPVAVWMMSEDRVELPGILRGGLTGLVTLTGFLLGFLVIRLLTGGWISIPLGLVFVLSLGVWIFAHFKLAPGWIAISSLLLVNGVRIAGIELGERDIRGLREMTKEGPLQLAYFMEHEDIWHEAGLISAALHQPVGVFEKEGQIEPFLSAGGRIILNEDQTALSQSLECQNWDRFKRRLKFPLVDLMLQGLRSDDPRFYRRFLVCRTRELDR